MSNSVPLIGGRVRVLIAVLYVLSVGAVSAHAKSPSVEMQVVVIGTNDAWLCDARGTRLSAGTIVGPFRGLRPGERRDDGPVVMVTSMADGSYWIVGVRQRDGDPVACSATVFHHGPIADSRWITGKADTVRWRMRIRHEHEQPCVTIQAK